MKIPIVFFFVLVIILAVVQAIPSKGSTTASLKKKPCIKDCSEFELAPICGGDDTGKEIKSFGSECVLFNYNCEYNEQLKVVGKGECPGGGGIRFE